MSLPHGVNAKKLAVLEEPLIQPEPWWQAGSKEPGQHIVGRHRVGSHVAPAMTH